MLNNHLYVQDITHTKGKPPSAIPYMEDQMDDLQLFVASGSDHVVGVDRAYNLGLCYMTSLVYKNLCVVQADTEDHPIMNSPLYLQWNTSFDAHHMFFVHIKRKFDHEMEAIKIHIGSDEARALVKALDSVFPAEAPYLSTKYLGSASAAIHRTKS